MGKRLLIVAASFLLAACSPAPVTPAADPAEAVAAVVEGFGSRLKNVSLLAPDAAQQIEAQYAEFVAPRLLDRLGGRSTSGSRAPHVQPVARAH